MTDKIVCKVCHRVIAHADLEKLTIPFTADQFKSVMPQNNVPPPFPENIEVHDWRCPYCNSFPIYGADTGGEDSRLFGVHVFRYNRFCKKIIEKRPKKKKPLGRPKKRKFICEECGAVYNHQPSLSRHKREKHKKVNDGIAI